MRPLPALARLRTKQTVALPKTILVAAPLMLGAASLTGCQDKARQDVFTTPNATCAAMMPTVSGTRTYAPRQADSQNEKLPPNSVVAYPDPETPAYCDRPLSDTLPTSLELADYTRALSVTDLLPLLQRKGPYTVFAIPNSALEHYAAQQAGGDVFAQPKRPTLHHLLAYSIVPGHWAPEQIKAAIQAAPNHVLALPTLADLPLYAQLDTASGQIIVGNGESTPARLWVNGIPQSNGVLYFVQSLILPPTHIMAPTTPTIATAPTASAPAVTR
ncbi:MAG: fasciclin domain-containing protein [Acetobacter orientalis]|uniref:fasciclin domain-containing protein n=1 Tax=Acetobacter orientalis TaxID=146474 RepID=UPI0039EAFD78